ALVRRARGGSARRDGRRLVALRPGAQPQGARHVPALPPRAGPFEAPLRAGRAVRKGNPRGLQSVSAIDTTQTGLMSRSVTEIARVLQKVVDEGVPLASYFANFIFEAPLLLVDTKAGRIVIARSVDEAANKALLAR